MDFDTELAIKILNEDIDLHQSYFKRASKHFLEEGFDLGYLSFLSEDIKHKQGMIRDLTSENPDPDNINFYINRIKNTYIPIHEKLIGNKNRPAFLINDDHDKRWIQNYKFISSILEKKLKGIGHE